MSDPKHHLFNLPVRYGGMGLTNPSIFSDFQYHSSIKITSPSAYLILMQALPTNLNWVQHEIKKDVIKPKRQFLDNMSKEATIIHLRNLPYSIMRWVRYRIPSSLLRSTIMMLRGTRQKSPSLNFSSIPVDTINFLLTMTVNLFIYLFIN